MSEIKEPASGNTNNRSSVSCLISLLFLGIILSFFYFGFFKNPCKLPVKYSIGDVDPKFRITKDDVISVANDAANRWNSQSGSANLTYDPNSKLKINLIYDERQAQIDKVTSEVGALNSSGNAIDSLRNKIESEILKYQTDLTKYNAEVALQNSQGGASAETYNRLQQEKRDLEARRVAINSSANILNQQIDQQNSNIDQLNSEINANKNKIITQGLYYPTEVKIDIFTFGNKQELRLAVMHELGHALSLDHDSAAQSIMYPILEDQNLENPTLSTEDLQLFTKTCKSPINTLNGIIQNLKNFAKLLSRSTIQS